MAPLIEPEPRRRELEVSESPSSLLEIREHPPNSRHPWSILCRPKIPPTIETHTPSMASSLVTKIRTTTTRCVRSGLSAGVIAYPKRGGNRIAPTLSRFENGVSIPALFRLRELMVDQFLDLPDTPPRGWCSIWMASMTWPTASNS
ncbi:MAG: hypothetical protein R3C01_00855 [Planctomycetaceae bacterium]